MNYILVDKENTFHCQLLEELMMAYVAETDMHRNISTPKDLIPKIAKSMVNKLDCNRILVVVTDGNSGVGFCYAKIDRVGDRGMIRPDWGYVMELFVSPQYRKNGVGRNLINICEKFFRENGASNVWLTADSVTGIPFWIACGYSDSNEVSSENGQKVMTKHLNFV